MTVSKTVEEALGKIFGPIAALQSANCFDMMSKVHATDMMLVTMLPNASARTGYCLSTVRAAQNPAGLRNGKRHPRDPGSV